MLSEGSGVGTEVNEEQDRGGTGSGALSSSLTLDSLFFKPDKVSEDQFLSCLLSIRERY